MITNCCRKKHEIRVHEILSNGQHLNVYFKKHNTGKNHEKMTAVWTMGLCISETRKQANYWFLEKSKQKLMAQTGRVGLEGLRRSLQIIHEMVDSLGRREELQIGWADEKRKKAYRYLLRYGFQEADTDDCYFQRNPKYWEWVPN